MPTCEASPSGETIHQQGAQKNMSCWLKAFRCLPMLMWMAVIFYLSHQSDVELKETPWWLALLQTIPLPTDKILHFGVYGVLGLFAIFAMEKRPWMAWAICCLYGASDEFHQSFVPNRSVELMDGVADALGAGCAILIWTYGMARLKPCKLKGESC